MIPRLFAAILNVSACLFFIAPAMAADDTAIPAVAPINATEKPVTATQPAPVTAPAAATAPHTNQTTQANQTAPAAPVPAKPLPAPAPALPVNKPALSSPGSRPATPSLATPAAKPATAPVPKPALKPLPARPPNQAASAPPAAVAKPVPAPPPPVQNKQHPVTEPATIPPKPIIIPAPAQEISLAHTADIEVFIREGCPPCDKAKEFLDKLQSLQPQLKINVRDVRKEPASMELLKRLAQNQGTSILDYPAFVVSDKLIFGFSTEANTAQQILDNLPLTHSTSDETTDCTSGKEPGCGLIPAPPPEKPGNITISLLGYSFELAQVGLPLFTVAMGMLDGLNHGSTWVLILMISLLSPLQDRARIFSIAGTFIAIQAIIYLALIVAWFNIAALLNPYTISQYLFAGIALVAAAYYLRKYYHFDRQLALNSHEISKPGIYTYIRKIVEAESIFPALLATTVLAIYVQFTEFTLSSAFPILYGKVLLSQQFGMTGNAIYLFLYDLAYMTDDLIILAIGIVSLKQQRSEEHRSRYFALLSALLLIGCVVYLFKRH